MNGTILVVDDEQEIADLIELYLRNEGYAVSKHYNARTALQAVATEPVELAVLDVMLPDMDGFQLCRQIREQHHYPIILLTSRTEGMDRITGLTLGADDYVTKPFLPLELVARVKAHLRRCTLYNTAGPQKVGQMISFSGITLNKNNLSGRVALKKFLSFLHKKKINSPPGFSMLMLKYGGLLLCSSVLQKGT
ncbi:response regulator transcription factor [Paenibacillus donghaensis]|uniref:Response regulatory domain-containing protein n=1 Tax=Paenibacillus donghaensis TaxID=414771 RepID=A0A2Z2K8B0_9BACL|nr:response regulator transcription factor [Paenibacillus donghaensis]ASA21457.1 hypothetical protein B9T62_12120 [Paenibacillus donghaensis]